LGYRTQVGLIARAGINIQDLFFIGYAYETPMSNIASYSTGSHEVVLGLKFCRNKKKSMLVDEIKVDPLDSLKSDMAKKEMPIEKDTVFVQKIDTVFVTERSGMTDEEVKKVLLSVEKNLLFEKLKFNIETKSFEELKSLVDVLSIRPDIMIEIEGHTDNGGTEAENLELSKNRANQVKDYLIKNGVDASRVKTSFYGESKPIASNDTESGRQMNRRVRIKVIKKED
jgi:outer membrane protein OmpA-like peptidoglycan-associated protein